MKALIVPGITDLNKGDQALVWESHRLIMDTGVVEEAAVLEFGENPLERDLLSGQTRKKGIVIIPSLLQHPRRGWHPKDPSVLVRLIYALFMVGNSIIDFFATLLIIKSAKYKFLRVFFSKGLRDKIDSLAGFEVFVVKGGGFVHSYGERRAPYVIWYLLFYIRFAKAYGKKVVVLPNSYGPFDGWTVKSQVKSVLSGVSFISARERRSALALGNLLNKVVPVYPDLGFYLEGSKDAEADEIFRRYHISQDNTLVGITMRPWRFPEAEDPVGSAERYHEALLVFVKSLIEKGVTVLFLNQSLGPNTHEDDREAISLIYSKLSKSKNVFWINEDFPCDVLHNIYSKLDFLVGTRFHSVIFSLTSNVPCLAIAYGGNKAQGIMADIGLSDYVIPIDEVTSDFLIDSFDRVMLERDVVVEKIRRYNAYVRDERSAVIGSVLASIK